MDIKRFIDLISCGFDVSFNHDDVFYTISLISDNENGRKYGIGADNGFAADFESLESIPSFVLGNKTIESIINELPEEEIFF